MSAHESQPLILFSGLAADASIFAPQKIAFPQLVVPRWPIPQVNDTLDSCCKRIADELRPLGRCVIGGASFGGIVALGVAQYLDPLGVLLIGSVRSPTELPYYLRMARRLGPLVRFIPVSLLQFLMLPIASAFFGQVAPHFSGLARQFCNSDSYIFKWSIRQLLEWQYSPNISCPILQLHGKRDFVLPLRYTSPDKTVVRGGHVISLTHPNEVNDFIRWALNQIVTEQDVPQ